MTRVNLNMTMMDVVVAMGDGNPGGLTIMGRLIREGEEIDPQDFMGGFGKVLSLDTLGIYGSRIWMLYKDVCGENMVNMVAMLRGWQLGYLTEGQLNHAIDNYGDGVDVTDILEQVRQRLPDFA